MIDRIGAVVSVPMTAGGEELVIVVRCTPNGYVVLRDTAELSIIPALAYRIVSRELAEIFYLECEQSLYERHPR